MNVSDDWMDRSLQSASIIGAVIGYMELGILGAIVGLIVCSAAAVGTCCLIKAFSQ